MRGHLTIFLIYFIFGLGRCLGQPVIEWQKCLGGSGTENSFWIYQTNDSGYVAIGYSYSNDGNVSGHHGSLDSSDLWLAKLDISGNLQWQKSYGGSKMETTRATVIQTSDNGFLISGTTFSNNGDVSGNHGESDCWIVKTDNVGNIQWQKCFGGSSSESGAISIQTQEGDYMLTCSTRSNNGNVTGNHGGQDIWIFKIDSSGNLIWQKCFGGSNDEGPESFFKTNDGNYAITATTASSDGDVTINHGLLDFWLVKIDTTGNILLQKTYGGINADVVYEGIQTQDSGFMLVGYGYDSATVCNYILDNGWIVKTDSLGNIQWEKCYGGSSPTDIITSVKQLAIGDYALAGITGSNDGDVSGNHGFSDAWLLRIDSIGNIKWQKALGGSLAETASSLVITYDNGYIIIGHTASDDGDVNGNHSPVGGWDYWVVKLAPDTITGLIGFDHNSSLIKISPNPSNGNFDINYQMPQNDQGKLEIFDLTGKLLYSQKLPKWSIFQRINLSEIRDGFYFCVVTTTTATFNTKMAVIVK